MNQLAIKQTSNSSNSFDAFDSIVAEMESELIETPELIEEDVEANNTLMQHENGFVPLHKETLESAWATAIDVVDYPVQIQTAYYKQDDMMNKATALTNTGRESQFQFVVVDKNRIGDWNPIACVSDVYGTVETPTAYQELRDQLDNLEIPYTVNSVYVTGNGGSQQLTLQMNDVLDMAGIPDRISLRVVFSSSVDGTKSHTINLLAYNHSVDAVFDFSGSVERLSARHTNTLAQRTINFIPAITKLVKNWNEQIVPFMMLMRDGTFDASLAKTLVEEVAGDAGIGEQHTSKIVSLYSSSSAKTAETDHNLYRINATIGQYIAEELSDKPELQQRMIKGLGKSIRKAVKKRVK